MLLLPVIGDSDASFLLRLPLIDDFDAALSDAECGPRFPVGGWPFFRSAGSIMFRDWLQTYVASMGRGSLVSLESENIEKQHRVGSHWY